ncbi:SusC/RagA family TonB-linked outer membrane protein [Desertivirga arenae]|uniref:SusC/RagA family TonB-linked outer membrane protein n=1 Tax=Desertivirga arenae TaxID=2810309 RepID=UPI001A976B80|nr:SusC/RagA family TonB-linked outer membrane protein [Pedobacter sp. SYSU D00823]
MKNIKCYWQPIVVLMLLWCTQGYSQTANKIRYKGRITSETGDPVSNARIGVVGGKGAYSNHKGEFIINCTANDTLLVSHSGFAPKKIAAADPQPEIVLDKTESNPDEEYVRIPFDSRRKRELNYAVSSLDASDLPRLPLSNLSTILAGRLSGLLVNQTSNQPGGDNANFMVRGRSSYAAGNTPTVLVDGIERDFIDMDISEIESISVLKDAAALNWYGLYASNGAILVSTKRGKPGRSYLSFDAQGGFQSVKNLATPLNSYDFASLYNQGLRNANQVEAYNQTALNGYRDQTDPYLYPDNNYVGRFLRSSAPTQRYALTFGGGGDRLRYFSALTFYNQDGLFKETETENYDPNLNFKKYNFRLNLDYDVTKSLGISLLAGLRREQRSDVGEGSAAVFNNLFNLPPNAFPILNADGSYGGNQMYQNNPLGQLRGTGYTSTSTNVLLATLSAKQRLDFITNGLSVNALFSYDGYGNYTNGLTENYVVVDPQGNTLRTSAILAYRFAGFGNNTKNNEFWAGLDYDRTFGGKHKVTAAVRGQQYISHVVDQIDYRGRMLVMRADYGFKDRYFAGFTASYSGSENFAPNSRFGFFPAASTGWVVSDEQFLRGIKAIDYLKIRASYGRSGNVAPTYDANGNLVRLPYRALYTRGSGPILGSSFSSTTTAYEIGPTGNPETTWEKIDRLNIGADTRFFRNSLSLSFDYFNEKRRDILGDSNLPGILGITVSSVNSGKARTEGFDAGLKYMKAFNDLQLSFNGNFTYANNKVVFRDLPAGIIDYQSPIGYNIGNVGSSGTKQFYIAEGLFQNQAEIDASPKQALSGLVVPGDIKYRDVNGDNTIDSRDAVATNFTDIPKVYYGFGFNLNYKIFDLNTQFQGIEGRTIDIKPIVFSGPNGLNQLSRYSWTAETASEAQYPRIALSDNANNRANSDFWLRSGDYLKLRTVELGISLPAKVLRKIPVKAARLYVGGYNLFTFSELKGLDIDPETSTAGVGSNYPYVKTYALGLNVKL